MPFTFQSYSTGYPLALTRPGDVPFDPYLSYMEYFASGGDGEEWVIPTRELFAAALGSLGVFNMFAGPGPNPLVNPGAAANKVWVRTRTGGLPVPADIRVWTGVAPSSDETNWVALDQDGFRRHLRIGRSMLFEQASALLTWTINHNFGWYPQVTVFGSYSGGVLSIERNPAVVHASVNQTILTFSSVSTGAALLTMSPPDGAIVAPIVTTGVNNTVTIL